MKTVLITGVGGPAGRASATFFRDKGCDVIGTDVVRVHAPVGSLYMVPKANDPQFRNAILRLIDSEKPELFIPTVSEELPFVARFKHDIAGMGTSVYIPDPHVVDIANDKYVTATHLRSLGVAAPRTMLASDVKSPSEAGRILGFPFIAKPRIGRGGRGVTIFRTGDQEAEPRADIVYQEFMPGEEYDVNLFAFPGGHTMSVVVLLKTALKGGIVGNALRVQRVICRDVAELAIVAARKLHVEGPVDMDVRRDSNGVPKILEINARVGGNVLSAREVLEDMSRVTLERRMSNAVAHVSYAEHV